MKIIKVISVPILVVYLGLFFYNYNFSFKEKEEKEEVIEKTLQKSTILENYIIGVVACEMPASYNMEALKAQAVAARTFAYYKIKEENFAEENLVTANDQCYIDDEQMHDKWKNTYDKYNNIIIKAVKETEGIILTKDNQLLKTYYFSTSNGYTEDAISVFNSNQLSSVESPWDKSTSGYKKETKFSKEELEKIFGEFTKIEIISRNKTNRVNEVKVDNKTYSGITFRKLLNLRSTDFHIQEINQEYIITTFGYGHGVGMSQTGANELAKQNYDYRYILKYYYNTDQLINIYV